ncbi:hypothetical protein BJ742DRAFT_904800 [Cladochytrium replicatum]|nr:hypothetical protein BJ742DRAFT_904800 [Cladochytrium replicatum]
MATASAQPSRRSTPASHADRSTEDPPRQIPSSNQTVNPVPNPSDSVPQPNGPDSLSQSDRFDSASTTGSDSTSTAADKKNTLAPFAAAPAPAVNIWKVRMEQLQDKVAKDKTAASGSVSTRDAPKEKVKETNKDMANKDEHGHHVKEHGKEERTKRIAEKERVRNEEEEKDAADGFVKVLSKAAKRSSSQLKPVAVNGVGKKGKEHKGGDREGKKEGEKGKKESQRNQAATARKEIESVKVDDASSAVEKDTISETPSTTPENPSAGKPSATSRSVAADPKTEASATESVASEHSVDTLRSISEPVSSPPKKMAKVVALNARSEDRLGSKSSSAESGTLQKLDVWPTLGEQPQSSQENTHGPARATSPARAQVNGSASGSAGEGKKTVWTKMVVPIRYTPPPSVAARKAQKEAGERGESESGSRRSGKGEKSGRSGKSKENAQKSGTASGFESLTDIESPVTAAPPTTSVESGVESVKGETMVEPVGEALVEQAASEIPEVQGEHSQIAATIENEKATATAPGATMTHPLPPPPPYANRSNRGGLNNSNQRGPPRGNRNSAPPRMNNGQRIPRNSFYNNNMYPGTAPFVQGPHQQNPYYHQGYPEMYGAPQLPQYQQQYGRRQQYGGHFAGQPAGYPTYGYNSISAADPERADLETVKLWIRSQVEYYFSIENLCRDLYFRRQMDSVTGSVSLAMIANFPRVKSLLQLARNKLGQDPKSGGTTPIDEPAITTTTTSPATPKKPIETKYELKWALDIMAASLHGSEIVEIVSVKASEDLLIRRRENWKFWILNEGSTTTVIVNGDADHHATSPRQPPPAPISTHQSTATAPHSRIQQVQSATYGFVELSTPPNTPANTVPYLSGSFPAPGNVFFGAEAIAEKLAGGVTGSGEELGGEGSSTGRKRQLKGSTHQYYGPQQTQQQRGS